MSVYLRHPIVVRAAQIAIGLLFLTAALSKLADLGTFAQQIRNYHLVPIAATNLIAIALPWIELLAGLSLVLGVRPRSGAWIAIAGLLVFTVAVASALARGLNFECGCFGTVGAGQIGARKLAENVGMLVVAAIASVEPH